MELWAGEHRPSLAAGGGTELLLNYMLCTDVVLHLMEFTSMTRTTNMTDFTEAKVSCRAVSRNSLL